MKAILIDGEARHEVEVCGPGKEIHRLVDRGEGAVVTETYEVRALIGDVVYAFKSGERPTLSPRNA